MPLVTDTHPLLYFEAAGGRKALPKRVLQAFESAANGREIIFVPTIVFYEIERLRQRDRISLTAPSIAVWTRSLLRRPGFVAQEITTEIVLEAAGLRALSDPVDALIVGTARALDLPLITRDRQIADSGLARILW